MAPRRTFLSQNNEFPSSVLVLPRGRVNSVVAECRDPGFWAAGARSIEQFIDVFYILVCWLAVWLCGREQ